MRTFLHRTCGKISYPQLNIQAGPKKTERAEFYKRQCCRLPLPELREAIAALQEADAAAATASSAPSFASSKAALDARQKAERAADMEGYSIQEIRDLLDCTNCGWDACMPTCPIEWDEAKCATFKAYRPRLSANQQSVENELRIIETTRHGLMEHLRDSFNIVDPHIFTDDWTSHMRNMAYSVLTLHQIAISTDFAAQFDHKAAWTSTCEHPPRSSMDVFVVTRMNEQGA